MTFIIKILKNLNPHPHHFHNPFTRRMGNNKSSKRFEIDEQQEDQLAQSMNMKQKTRNTL